MDLGVTVLAGLGGRHVDDLAGAVLDHDEAVLAQSRALDGERSRSTGIGRVEGGLVLEKISIVFWYMVQERDWAEQGAEGEEMKQER